MDATAISIAGLVKTFGPTRALDGLDLSVRTGEVHGFLGPNGAGKTTTIRILLGLLRADAGTATLLGGDPWRDAVALHRRLAYVPGDVTLWPNLSGGEVIDLLSSHILAEVEALCERVSIIRAGRIVESGTLAELRHLTRTSIQAELARPPDGLTGLAGVHDLQLDGTRVHLQVDTPRLDEVMRHLSAAGLRSLVSQPLTLDELLLRR